MLLGSICTVCSCDFDIWIAAGIQERCTRYHLVLELDLIALCRTWRLRVRRHGVYKSHVPKMSTKLARG